MSAYEVVGGQRRRGGLDRVVEALHLLSAHQIGHIRLAEQLLPQLHVHQLAHGINDLVEWVVVQVVDNFLVAVIEVRPHAEGALLDVLVDSFDRRVA